MPEIPIFPLKTVLFPDSRLALKIFEPRYLDMVANCLREDCFFGIVLIHRGEETLLNADIHAIGTTASICDWEHRADGLLGITALGKQRFEIVSTTTQSDGLVCAEINLLKDEETQSTPEQYRYMQELLDHIRKQDGGYHDNGPAFTSMIYQLIDLLPLDNQLKQRLLEVPTAQDRAVVLHAELIRLGIIQYVKPDTHRPANG